VRTREPDRGDIWSVSFDPTVGHEQAGTRPALVVSIDKLNHGPADLAIVLPITSHDKGQPIHVQVTPPEGGLSVRSFVKCEDIRSVSKQRLKRFCGTVTAQTMSEVERRMRILLKL
jgi:mRNA interferase MazF